MIGSREQFDQIAKFLRKVRLRADHRAHLLFEHYGEALPEGVGGLLDGVLIHTEPRGDLLPMRAARRRADESLPQFSEKLRPFLLRDLLIEPRHREIEQRPCPAPVEAALGRFIRDECRIGLRRIEVR